MQKLPKPAIRGTNISSSSYLILEAINYYYYSILLFLYFILVLSLSKTYKNNQTESCLISQLFLSTFNSSVRSSYSHPDLLVIHHHPLFQITPLLNNNIGLSLSEPLQLYIKSNHWTHLLATLGCPKKSKSPNFGMPLTPVVFIG